MNECHVLGRVNLGSGNPTKKHSISIRPEHLLNAGQIWHAIRHPVTEDIHVEITESEETTDDEEEEFEDALEEIAEDEDEDVDTITNGIGNLNVDEATKQTGKEDTDEDEDKDEVTDEIIKVEKGVTDEDEDKDEVTDEIIKVEKGVEDDIAEEKVEGNNGVETEDKVEVDLEVQVVRGEVDPKNGNDYSNSEKHAIAVKDKAPIGVPLEPDSLQRKKLRKKLREKISERAKASVYGDLEQLNRCDKEMQRTKKQMSPFHQASSESTKDINKVLGLDGKKLYTKPVSKTPWQQRMIFDEKLGRHKFVKVVPVGGVANEGRHLNSTDLVILKACTTDIYELPLGENWRSVPGPNTDYSCVIQNPIALENIIEKCELGNEMCYKTFIDYSKDWQLMYANAVKYNGEGNQAVKDLKKLIKKLEKLLESRFSSITNIAPQPKKKAWKDCTVQQLKDELKARNLRVGGRKKELIQRLNASDIKNKN